MKRDKVEGVADGLPEGTEGAFGLDSFLDAFHLMRSGVAHNNVARCERGDQAKSVHSML